MHLCIEFVLATGHTHMFFIMPPAPAGPDVLSKNLMRGVGKGDDSCSRAQSIASAALKTGSRGAVLHKLSNMGAGGKHQQNVERDMHRLCSHIAPRMPELYEVDTLVQMPGKRVCKRSWPILLPHEVFSSVAIGDPSMFERVFGCPTHADYWNRMSALQEPWWLDHPFREKAEANPALATPARLFGDDTGLRKSDNIRLLQWCAIGCELPSWKSKIPIYVLPLKAIISSTLTEGPLQEAIAWSFWVLGTGVHPHADHLGDPCPPEANAQSWQAPP